MVATDSTSETVTILFTDLVGSTEISGALGEEKSNAHRRLHFRLLREAIRDYRGHEVKSLGDGVMVVFPSAAEAVYCAVAMQKAAEKHNAGAEIACLDIRIGIHTGEPIHEDAYDGPTLLWEVDYARDAIGRIGQKVETIDGITTTYDYEYDADGQLEYVHAGSVRPPRRSLDLTRSRFGLPR